MIYMKGGAFHNLKFLNHFYGVPLTNFIIHDDPKNIFLHYNIIWRLLRLTSLWKAHFFSGVFMTVRLLKGTMANFRTKDIWYLEESFPSPC